MEHNVAQATQVAHMRSDEIGDWLEQPVFAELFEALLACTDFPYARQELIERLSSGQAQGWLLYSMDDPNRLRAFSVTEIPYLPDGRCILKIIGTSARVANSLEDWAPIKPALEEFAAFSECVGIASALSDGTEFVRRLDQPDLSQVSAAFLLGMNGGSGTTRLQ